MTQKYINLSFMKRFCEYNVSQPLSFAGKPVSEKRGADMKKLNYGLHSFRNFDA